MKKAVTELVVLILMVCMSSFAHAEIIDLYAVADAEITGTSAGSYANTNNWGGLLNLAGNVNKTGGPTSAQFPNYGDSRGLFKFDLSAIPAGATINSATVSIYVNFNAFSPVSSRLTSVSLYQVTADWTETGVTYDTKPAWGAVSVTSMSIPAGTGSGGNIPFNGYINGNITSLVQGWLNGTATNFGLATSDTYTSAGLLRISARETSGTSQDPRLRVTYTPAPPASNAAPVANNQSVSTAEDAALAIILAATDAETNALIYAVVTGPSHGVLSTISSNVVTYTPATNYYGPDSFTFKANDGLTDSVPAMVSITVMAVNDAPIAQPQSVSTTEDAALAITLTATDAETNALTYTVMTSPANGTLSGTAPNVTYIPAANYNGADSFTFIANDGMTDSVPATISIAVTLRPRLAISMADPTLNVMQINITGPTGCVSKVQYTTNLMTGTWTDLESVNNFTGNHTCHFTNNLPNVSSMFFRSL